MQKCIFARQRTAEHFPLENVQQTKMLESGKMHFGVHFPKENVQQSIHGSVKLT